MKYIRTKDGRIAEIKENMTVIIYKNASRLVYKDRPYISVLHGDDDILKQADTIEELFDEVVYEEQLYKSARIFNSIVDNETYVRLTDVSLLCVSVKQKEWPKIRGAIWTDKGLIYAAEVKGVLPNGEIDWALL